VVDLAPSDQLRCWGRNDRGQVGKGDFLSPVDLPANVTLPFVPLDVEAGALHTCVLSALLPQDGSQLACWGENGSGQLGLGDTLDRFTPQVVDLAGAVAFDVATGANHTCAVVTGGAVRCWGSNQFGQLGVSLGTTSSSTPLTVPGVVAERVVVGDAHTCVIVQSDQSVRCWGLGTSGQLGNGSDTSSVTPVNAGFRSGTQLVDLDAGGSTTCAREASTVTWCWGAGLGGQIGDGASLNRNQPTRPSGLQRYEAIAVGAAATCGVSVQRLECWGVNALGAIGDTTTSDRSRPVTVQLGPVQVGVGDRHACVLRTGGTVWCWGENGSGQLANTDLGAADQTVPVQVAPALTPGVVSVDAGADHTCALRADATVWCWGENGSGQVGVPGPSDVSTPTQVAGLSATPVLQVVAGGSHTCVLLADRTVRCWGSDAQGQLGDGTAGGSLVTPTAPVGVGEVLSLAAGGRHTCAVRTNGTVWCWGENAAGQLGRGTTGSPVATPAPVLQLAGAASVAAGEFHTCATLPSGTARCWGTNSSFQLGNGTTVDSAVPVTVVRATLAGDVPATGLQSLDAGGFHNCGVTREGSVDLGLCWGANLSGQLGGGVSLAPGYPQLVTVVDRVRQLSGGGDSTCAIAEDGGAWCFGDNSSGQLGRGTTSPFGTVNAAPVEVTGLGPI
jgi:alpha-tubulin suppressor-like RCC1 family protein